MEDRVVHISTRNVKIGYIRNFNILLPHETTIIPNIHAIAHYHENYELCELDTFPTMIRPFVHKHDIFGMNLSTGSVFSDKYKENIEELARLCPYTIIWLYHPTMLKYSEPNIRQITFRPRDCKEDILYCKTCMKCIYK